MIGVVSKHDEADTVKEFFELFKVPWEFYNQERTYSVILSTQDLISHEDRGAKCVLLYSSDKTSFDRAHDINLSLSTQTKVKCRCGDVPIYGKLSDLDTAVNAAITFRTTTGQAAGIEIHQDNKRFIRIGYNLFQEVHFLLTSGQPPEYSRTPTLEAHIECLREWILASGLPLVEIPPVPAGFRYACCLTHDIDFEGIRRHKCDRTMLGFLYRALFGSLRGVLTGKIPWKRLYENWKAVCLLPAVYSGFAEDFWRPFDHYRKVEKELRSTFFIIPFKNRCGMDHGTAKSAGRATRYDISDISGDIQALLSDGYEIGLHGIDAWCNRDEGRKEYDRIHVATGTPAMGIRMHWLYFNEQTPKILEDLGFSYDSTSGYNDAVGYRNGTTQAYRPIGMEKLFELPMHIQDTALFFPDRMGLTEDEAWIFVQAILENSEKYGGVLTINWHDRSLAPERLWGDFYIKLLEHLKNSDVWIDTASRVIRWFEKRRSVSFENLCVSENHMKVHVVSKRDDGVPDLIARIYAPKNGKAAEPRWVAVKEQYQDLSFSEVLNEEISL